MTSRGRDDGERGLLPIGIFWDIRHFPIPPGVDHAVLVKRILEALRGHFPSNYYPESLFVYGDAGDVPTSLPCIREHEGLQYKVRAGDPGLQILYDMMHLAFDHTSPQARAGIALISQEPDHVTYLQKFSMIGYRGVRVFPSKEDLPRVGGFPLTFLDWQSVVGDPDHHQNVGSSEAHKISSMDGRSCYAQVKDGPAAVGTNECIEEEM